MIIAIVIGVSCLFWIIAAILFVCAKGVDRRISESKKDCVEKTTATVVDVEEVYKRNVDTYNYTWYPVYEFYVNGERDSTKECDWNRKKFCSNRAADNLIL